MLTLKERLNMRLLKGMIISLFLFGCSTPTEEINKIRYYKDIRTNLCFVENYTYAGHIVFANVPCSPEVERLIKP